MTGTAAPPRKNGELVFDGTVEDARLAWHSELSNASVSSGKPFSSA